MTIRRLQHDYSSQLELLSDDEEEDITFCENCQSNGGVISLNSRRESSLTIKGKRLPDPPDADNFIMCWTCGYVITNKGSEI